jgi:hypothetical protein
MYNSIVKIKKIKKITSNSLRYDIETKKNNNFFANGMLIHNSCISIYWDENKLTWFAATTGTAEGEGEVNNSLGTTFNDLFWRTVKDKYNFDTNLLNKEFCYVFELTTPYNIVVKPHGESSATLLTARSLTTFKEISYDSLKILGEVIGVPVVKQYDLNAKDIDTLIATFDESDSFFEGYVICDSNFNRVKVKSPKYISIHHLKNRTAEYAIIDVIKANEIEEFITVIPERKNEILELKIKYDILISNLDTAWENISKFLPINDSPEEKKRYALSLFSYLSENDLTTFSGLFFSLASRKITSVVDYILNYDSKTLYKILLNLK